MAELKVSHCPNCGRIFQNNVRNLCSDCASAIDQHLVAIEKYMMRHRQADNEELSQQTDIPAKTIQRYIRLGKISTSYYQNLYDACDACGGRSRSGNICSACKSRLRSDIQSMLESERSMKERARLTASFKFRESH